MAGSDARAEKFTGAVFAAIMCLIGLGALLLGSGTVFLCGRMYLAGRQMLAQAAYTTGTITKATERPGSDDDNPHYNFDVDYTFTDFAGVTRRGQESLFQKAAVGDRLRVVYRRDQPDSSELVTKDVGRKTEGLIAGVGACIALFGGTLLFFGLRHARRLFFPPDATSRPPPLPVVG